MMGTAPRHELLHDGWTTDVVAAALARDGQATCSRDPSPL
jgi:hypothetical protein